MNRLLSFSIPLVFVAFISMFFSYVDIENYVVDVSVGGFDMIYSYGQFIIYIIVILISAIRRTRISAIISFVLCFAFGIYFVIFYQLLDGGDSFDFQTIGFGFQLAVFTAILFFKVHLINLILTFRKPEEKLKADEIIDDLE